MKVLNAQKWVTRMTTDVQTNITHSRNRGSRGNLFLAEVRNNLSTHYNLFGSSSYLIFKTKTDVL